MSNYKRLLVEEELRPEKSVHAFPTQYWLFSEVSKNCLDKFSPWFSSNFTAVSWATPEPDTMWGRWPFLSTEDDALTSSFWNGYKPVGGSKLPKKGNCWTCCKRHCSTPSADKPTELLPIWKPISFWPPPLDAIICGGFPPKFKLIFPIPYWVRFCKVGMKGNWEACFGKWPITSAVPLEGIALVEFEPACLSAEAGDFELLLLLFLFLRHPPPTGTFLRAPPRVQYRRHVLQKWRGCVRL